MSHCLFQAVPKLKRNGKITYSVELIASTDGRAKVLNALATTETSVTLKTKTVSLVYIVNIKAMTSLGPNVILQPSRIIIDSDGR